MNNTITIQHKFLPEHSTTSCPESGPYLHAQLSSERDPLEPLKHFGFFDLIGQIKLFWTTNIYQTFIEPPVP